ncbi:MAG: methyltransferase domain-containing protein [Melioribacteraceae bacterium]|nr:methyltransferase domain-containing protein [Melioribacteraceae bacterium]
MVHQIDTQKTENFAEKLLGTLNQGALSIMVSIGHRTGLFDVMSELPPSTSTEIAQAAGLSERYVREWLGAMLTGFVVEYNPDTKKYHLPQEHASFLTRKAAANNIGVFAQYIPLLGTVEDKVIDCFKNGGGVSYSEYERFQDVMSEDSNQSVVSSLLEVILPAIPGIVDRLEEGIEVVDLGCGRGNAINLMAKTFPKSNFLGYDLSEEAIDYAKAMAEKQALKNVSFEVRDLTDYNITAQQNKFDFVTTFDAVHDQARPDNLLKGIYKSLKENGVYLMQDISASSEQHKNVDHPIGTLLYTISTMHCMTVSLAQGEMGLGTMWGREKALEMLREVGFTKVEIKNFEHDIQNDYYIIKK